MSRPWGRRLAGMLAAVALLAGCAGEPLKVKPIAKTENPSALTLQLEQEISSARQTHVDLLSPTWFALAQASCQKARTGIEKGTQLSGILENIATGQAQLKQARLYADKSAKVLDEVIQSRDAAMAAGAAKDKKAFSKLEDEFLRLTGAVEENDMNFVHKRAKSLNDAYRAIELRAIKGTALGDVRRMIAAARQEKLDRIAPKSFALAVGKLAEADAVITKDRYAKEKIAAAVQQATFYAQRMQQIAQTGIRLKEMAPEDIGLWMENYFARTMTFLKQADRRNLSFDGQQEAIQKAITGLYRDQSALSSQLESQRLEIGKLKQRIEDLQGRTYQERADNERLAADKERLAAEKRFNELYNQVQGYFSADQAEVYKQSQQLVIRLKAMRFPVGKAVIMPDNYPLLKTVQKAIRTFDKPDVVIEGHTDSTGSEVMNQELSQQRAEAVRQYLIYNATLPAEKIGAVGYGSSRPLASNATAEGRAVNRRIDVIIKPVRK